MMAATAGQAAVPASTAVTAGRLAGSGTAVTAGLACPVATAATAATAGYLLAVVAMVGLVEWRWSPAALAVTAVMVAIRDDSRGRAM